MSLTDREVQERVVRIDALLERVEQIAEPKSRDAALAAVQGLLDLYGEGLARMVGHVADSCSDDTAKRVAAAFSGDELVSHLLLLHGLHPDELRDRVERALEEVRPYLRSHGGNVELVDIDSGVARVHLTGSCHGCASSELTLRTMVDDAVRAAAPELRGIESDDRTQPAAADAPELRGIESDDRTQPAAADAPALVPLRRAARAPISELAAL